MNLTETSKTLLEMLDKVDDSDNHITNDKISVSSRNSNTEFTFDKSYSPVKLKKKSEKVKNFLKKQNVPREISKEIIQNQENFEKWSYSIINPQNQKKPLTPTPQVQHEYSSIKSSSSFSSFKNEDGKILATDDLSPEQKRIQELEFRLSTMEKRLQDETQIRQILSDSLQKLLTCIKDKSILIKSSTINNVDTMFSRLNLPSPRPATARLLNQEIDSLISDLKTETKIPSPSLSRYSPTFETNNTANVEILSKGCFDLANSLAKGFYSGKLSDFAELSKNPVEFARQIGQIKQAHDVGLADIKLKCELYKKMCDQIEELDNKKIISEKTAELVQSLAKKMNDISIQFREEYEDLVDNLH
ncbi:hypothetical protein TVAG_170320 [Trichomonas vaginalis G3]|uniref:Uncharacterized protein n=1 Tax=Trichomonas vaginalis (strain ATCC PRA-98 / G3) TaxID=412133 RepID=A2DPH4_TRIV3|nr:hypothetical protein TVAGG3_0680550 [Trichomonas vaginalis G3]EAY17718.1 hypothetical protein TVAG_170320 [Trichomonas vaginalis G3]KAI5507878.1 hypothetical protein TVAGG3_0680550 [Trichomonas vaginalis G3]|eukprot:XP_001329853.1 hypothetical protein [Trichomonas vaginalis G3]